MQKTVATRTKPRGLRGAAEADAKHAERRTRADEAVGQDELEFTAQKQITLRCGESSITLTAAGKIIIRGKYIVSRSSGVQRIKGGAVQIN
jgi:uncharacterized protein (DUF2345 family)